MQTNFGLRPKNNNLNRLSCSHVNTFQVRGSARSEGFALLLDEGTRKSHSLAENSAFFSGFFRGISERKQFAQFVASLYFVYQAMEKAFEETENENVKKMDFEELRRIPSLEADMAFFYGPEWKATVKPTSATTKYVSRIEEIAASDPELLIAHQYTRYVGDLFGGQVMGGMASRSLSLENGEGVKFYRFDKIPDVKAFIEEWYAALNRLGLPEEKQRAVLDEANRVFGLNILLLEELEGSELLVMAKLALHALRERLGLL